MYKIMFILKTGEPGTWMFCLVVRNTDVCMYMPYTICNMHTHMLVAAPSREEVDPASGCCRRRGFGGIAREGQSVSLKVFALEIMSFHGIHGCRDVSCGGLGLQRSPTTRWATISYRSYNSVIEVI